MSLARYHSAQEIAQVAGLTERHVKRVLGNAQTSGALWFGCRLRMIMGECGPQVHFASLPDHIREAFIMRAQMDLPLPPPEQINFYCASGA
jgi:hypothetical protein